MGVCRARGLLAAPLPRVWEYIIDPRNMHRWAPLAEPVTGIDRPLQPGDRFTQLRKGFFRNEPRPPGNLARPPTAVIARRRLHSAPARGNLLPALVIARRRGA
jgi:hypothetical protein